MSSRRRRERQVPRRSVSRAAGGSGQGRIGAVDSGITLVEVLVSMTIFALVISLAYAALISVSTQTADTTARSDAVDQARLGIAHLDRQIRSGNVLYDPAQEAALGFPMSMRIYTQANAENKCVQWQITGGVLRMRAWSPDWPAAGSTYTGWQVIARDVVNDPTKPADTPFALVSSASSYAPRSVNVLLRVVSPEASGGSVEITTSLTGRNTVYGYDAGVCDTIPPA